MPTLSWEDLIRRHGAFEVHLDLGAYGSLTPLLDGTRINFKCVLRKPVVLYTTSPVMAKLGRRCDPLQRRAAFSAVSVFSVACQASDSQGQEAVQDSHGPKIPRQSWTPSGGCLFQVLHRAFMSVQSGWSKGLTSKRGLPSWTRLEGS